MTDVEQQFREWREAGLVRVTRKYKGEQLPAGVYLVQVLQPVVQEQGGAAARVFAHWQEVHAHPTAKLTAGRARLIRSRLKDYTEQQLCDCISGYRRSPHHMGGNETGTVYDDIELMLRDAKHIEFGIRHLNSRPVAVTGRSRDDPQAGIQVDTSREAWIREMRERTGNPHWEPPPAQRLPIEDIVRAVRMPK